MHRTRVLAGPLLRLLGLAVVLFAVALAHGATPHSAGGHGTTGAVTRATGPSEVPPHRGDVPPTASLATAAGALAGTSADGHDGSTDHGGHGVGSPAEHCASAQPQQGPALAQPRLAVSISEVVAPGCAPSARNADEPHPSDRPSAAVRALVVQQV
ncbi:hypothetical protein ACF1HJ_12325 [Streptomyces sp. NPDC013978]|uniref:hypothetical protein n=1 Tax=Streptomyces sp. NPDC013978 TaxID=3364869 RepID=UPI0036FE2743